MRKLRWLVVVAAILAVAMPAMAAKKTRTTVVVTKGWPLTRPLRTVVVRPVRSPIVVTTSAYLPPVVWVNATVPLPAPDAFVWEGSETLSVDDDWAEFSLQFGTPLCDVASCGVNGASDGAWWVWFGGIDDFEQASVEQQVLIPPTATDLRFDLFGTRCDSIETNGPPVEWPSP